jgi:diguanylate cyclase (GGDEF)-like protein
VNTSARIWIVTLLGFVPLLGVLAVQTAVGLPPAVLVASTIVSIGLGSGLVIMSARHDSLQKRTLPVASHKNAFDASGEDPQDPLTGLPTFQPFSRRLFEEYQHVVRERGQVAVVLADVSQLGRINDEFGIEVGDSALKHVGECLRQIKRAKDVVARAGDDEFALVLPDCDGDGAAAFVSRAQSWLNERPLKAPRAGSAYSLWIGLCAGYAVCGDETDGPDDVLAAAIQSLGDQRAERDLRQSRWAVAA